MERLSSSALVDQRVVVIGGTSGMGAAIARSAHAAGAAVISAGRRPLDQRPPTPGIDQAIADATDEPSIRALFERGRVDHVVVTAAPAPGSWHPFLAAGVAELRRFVDDKLFGSLACARWAAPAMSSGGSITFVTGVGAVKPRAGMPMVHVAFAAVEALARALAIELAPIRVNAIRPGVIDSEMWSFLDADARERLRDRVRATFPVGRVGTVDDIASAAMFLMTNNYVTGSILEVTGGEQFVEAP